MSEPAAAEDTLTAIRREIERNALRARNGLKYLAGGRFAKTGVTPCELVWQRGKAKLWRYRGEQAPTRHPPVLTYVGLVSRAKVFDLLPGNSFVAKMLGEGGISKWGKEKLDANPDMWQEREISQGLEEEKKFWAPICVRVDAQGRVFVVESARQRIQVYKKIDPYFVGKFDNGRL